MASFCCFAAAENQIPFPGKEGAGQFPVLQLRDKTWAISEIRRTSNGYIAVLDRLSDPL